MKNVMRITEERRGMLKLILTIVSIICLGFVNAQTPIVGGEDCNNAVSINVGSYTSDGPSSGGGALNQCTVNGTNADWFSFTASQTGVAVISATSGANLNVYSGSCGVLTCEESRIFYTNAYALWDVVIGQTYTIEFDDRYLATSFDFDLSIDVSGNCPDVTSVNAYSTSNSALNFSFSLSSLIASGVYYEIQPTGVAQGTSIPIASATIPNFTTSVIYDVQYNFTPGQSYTLYIATECGSNVGTFNSFDYVFPYFYSPNLSCPTGFSNLDFFETFENGTPTASGWSGSSFTGINGDWGVNSGGTPTANTGPSGPQFGNDYLYVEATGNGSSHVALASTPAVNIPNYWFNGNDVELSFYYHAFGSDVGTLKVFVTNSANTITDTIFELSGQLQTSSSDPYAHIGILLPNTYVTTDFIFHFVYNGIPNGEEGDIAIDNVEIRSCLDCIEPAPYDAQNITENSADIFWTDFAVFPSFWEIEIVESGIAPSGIPTDVVNSNNFYTFINALPCTSYDFYIRSECGGGLMTPWSFPYTFQTSCPPPIMGDSLFGQYYVDANMNCVLDTGEQVLANELVGISNNNGVTSFTVTDANGYYYFDADTALYNIFPVPPNLSWNGICANSVVIPNGQTAVDVGISSTSPCPVLEVDITTNFLSCSVGNGYYFIEYENSGGTTEDSVYIEVLLEPNSSIVSSPVAYTSLGNDLYYFFIGDLDPFESGTFQFTISLDCSQTVLGQTVCAQAEIFPQNNCIQGGPNYDGSDLTLFGTCGTDSVEFELKNIGANMTGSSSIIAIEDDILIIDDNVTLNNGQSILYKFPKNGKSYWMFANQRPDYPFMPFYVSDYIEGCVANSSTSISLGNAFILPPPLPATPYISTWCETVIGSYDPNDKQNFPIGYDMEHYIEQNETMVYKVRFQNTGTDTAYTVFIKDVISEHLDIATFEMIGASHDYIFQFSNDTLRVDFPGILLPDSGANQIESNGYFAYRIGQKEDVSIGTVIENTAAIYFDNNAPIVTNTVFNTVGDDFIKVALINAVSDFILQQIKVYPNPFHDIVNIDLGDSFEDVSLTIHDQLGRKISQKELGNIQEFQISKDELKNTGMFFFEIKSKGEFIASGKLMTK